MDAAPTRTRADLFQVGQKGGAAAPFAVDFAHRRGQADEPLGRVGWLVAWDIERGDSAPMRRQNRGESLIPRPARAMMYSPT